MSKLPEDFKKQFEVIKENTDNFSDEDLNAVFAENFNDLYSLVESRHPEALVKGGKIHKEKPAKVKKVKAKKVGNVTDTEALTKEAKEEYHKKIAELKKKTKLSADDIEFIEGTLRNDEASTDEEMVDHFVEELGITEAQAKKWVKLRNKYLKASVEESVSYSERTKLKKEARKEKGGNYVKTRDGHEFNRKDPKMKGKKFYDENGKQWECVGYNAKLDECIMKDEDGKEISSCIRDMYVSDPTSKRKKGDLVDDCKETLKQAGYAVKEHKKGTKKIRRKEPRPERDIIKERVSNTFVPILKDISGSEEKDEKNKEVIDILGSIEKLIVKFFNRLNNLAEDGKAGEIKKIEKLLKELVD